MGFWMFLAAQVTSCGHAPHTVSQTSGVRDNASLLLIENTFLAEEDEHPRIKGPTLSYMLMSSPSGVPKAYAIDCRGGNIDVIAAAFGVDASNRAPGSDSYAFLDEQYAISKQPILRCTSAIPGNDPNQKNASISNVFQLIDDRPAEEKAKQAYPDIFVRFSNLTSDDSVNQEQFYSIGCRNILNVLGTDRQKSLADAIPILASTIDSVFPNFKNYDPLNCMTNTLPPLLGQQPKKVEDLSLRSSKTLVQSGLEFYRVIDALSPTIKPVSYLLGQGNDFRRVRCYNIGADEIKTALNFPLNYKTPDIQSDDARYLNSSNQPELECVSIQSKGKFERRWSTVRENPAVNYYKKKDSKTIYRFGCLSAEKYFSDGLTLGQPEIKVTTHLIDYLSQSTNSGYKLVNIPCFDAGLPVDSQVLKDREVISLKSTLSNSNSPWLGGETSTGQIVQVPAQYSGTFWFVENTGEPGTYYLQSLGTDLGFSYLACPAEGNIPQMVKTKTQAGFSTKWTTYTGDGSSTVRFGCKSASGVVRLLNSNGDNPTLSDISTASDATTAWCIQHQTFVEDSTLLVPGTVVSIHSPTASQDNRWLSAYPGAYYEAGLDFDNSGASTYFRVEARTDGRGVSLQSLNFGNGDHYLDCKTEPEKLWMELAPVTTGGFIGTGFKAYRLTNSAYPIFKLACFDYKNSPRWVSITGRFPWLYPDAPANVSRADSILYVRTRAKEPEITDVKPRALQMARTNVVFENKCADDFDLAVLSYDGAWTTKATTLRSKTTFTVPVQSEYSYWYSSAHMPAARTDVTVSYRNALQKTVEFNHVSSDKALITKYVFCG